MMLRRLVVVSCAFVPGQINYFGETSPYWDCENWPDAMKTNSVEFNGLEEPTDKDDFTWICPERCKSMPYFDIKTTYSFKGYVFKKHIDDILDRWEIETIQDSYWKGNGIYRENYIQKWLTNLPSGESNAPAGSYSNVILANWKKFPDAQVKSVGECKILASQWNVNTQNEECSITAPHLSAVTGSPVDGVLDYKDPVKACLFQDEVVNVYNLYCYQQKRSDTVSVKPSYVFFRGSTGKPENAGTCEVVRYSTDSKTPDTTRNKRTNSAWSIAPRYWKHTYELKKIQFEPVNDFPLESQTNKLKYNAYFKSFDRNSPPDRSKVEYEFVKTKKYEWICKESGKWKYMQAKQYESKCSQEICQNFVTPPCWQNVYSIAALPCAWEKRVRENGATDGFVSLGQMTDFEYAKGMHNYGAGSYVITFPSEMDASTRTSPGAASVAIQSGTEVSIAANAELKFVLKPLYSCKLCEEASRDGVWGVVSTTNKKEMQLVECRKCKPYEKISDFSCGECLPFHTTRLWSRKGMCVACPAALPMRRSGGVHLNCTECEILNYFNAQNENGCLLLKSVRLAQDGSIEGVDEVSVIQGQAREIRRNYYRHVQSNTVWSSAVKELACDSRETAVSLKIALSYRRWCGHNEMKREQQALLQIGDSSRYYLYSTNSVATQGYAAISTVCTAGSWTLPVGGIFDVQCLDNRSSTVYIHAVREGNVEKCIACNGGRYTLNCWPTYHSALRNEEEEYFSNANLLSSAGTCDQCARRCALDGHYMSPVKFSCMWDEGRQGRVPGFVSDVNASAYFYWYKQAPCKPCKNVLLGATQAVLVKQCGNKATFRMWDKDQTRPYGSEERSIPMVQTCCSHLLSPSLPDNCTRDEDNANVFISENCKTEREMQDFEPVQENYCPSGWWVDESCAQKSSSIWSPDCCKRCLDCTGNMFKTENYAECTGATYIDTQATGCERRCLSNSYEKDGRCYRCESCSLTGTGEHGP